MAEKDNKKEKPSKPTKEAQKLENQLDDLFRKSNMAVFGTDGGLEDEAEIVKNVIRGTMRQTANKYGKRADGAVVNYFNELNFTSAFSDVIKDPSDKRKEDKNNPDKTFKKYMAEQDISNIGGILASETHRIIAYNNYQAIYKHIPEAAQALDTYKDNIMSPDDFTKLIFETHYESEVNEELKLKVEEQLDDILEKYELEGMAEEIIHGSLLYGDQYVAVLSLEQELDIMLTDPIMGNNINESMMIDFESMDILIESEDVLVDSNVTGTLNEMLVQPKKKKEDKNDQRVTITEKEAREYISHVANTNIQIGSKKELILERLSAERSKIKFEQLNDLPTIGKKDKSNFKQDRNDNKPMFINGSSIKILDPTKVVELKIDNTVYGYYYVEGVDSSTIPNSGYLGTSVGRELQSPTNIGSTLGTNNSKFSPQGNAFSAQGLSDAKVNLISKVFLDVIATKVDKDFIRHNKEFKDFLFNLIKQDYILRKEIKLTYFTPAEVVAFKVPPLYSKIVFFAKLYMAMLTNMLLIKMGRAHDKRVFYVDTGLDANYEQAISRVLQDIKTKEFKMDSLGDINTILNLNPGRFDDYFIPTMNGEKTIEIDTLQGMDIDLNNEFLEYLKDSMLSGMNIPKALIDATKDVEFARTLSALNSNFTRSVVKYQKNLTQPFNKMLRRLYFNEYRFSNDQESDVMEIVNIEDIKINFPSPMLLQMNNLTEQINTADQNAEFYTNVLEPLEDDQSNIKLRGAIKSEILMDLLPGVPWERYKDIAKAAKLGNTKEKIKASPESEEEALTDSGVLGGYDQGY
jgi:hypothetical protein